MAVNWNALQTPNFAAAYGQGVEFRQAQDDRKYARQMDERQMQRQDRVDARADERFGFEKEQFAAQRKDADQERLLKAIPVVGKLIEDVNDEAAWAARRADPTFRAVWSQTAQQLGLPDELDKTDFAAVKEFKALATRLAPKSPLTKVDLGPGEVGFADEEGNIVRRHRHGFTVGDYYMDPTTGGSATVDTSGNPVPPPPAPPGEAQPEKVAYRNAIASIESAGGGDYKAVGKVTRTGDRAYGRYQVMGANIGPWTRAALGREMTPEEFVANPQAQDAVFDHVFGGYVQQYGSPEEAASMWFTGRPLAQGANRRDVNGMTGSRYVEKFTAARGGQPEALMGGAGGDTISDAPDVPGFTPRRVKPAEPQERWVDLPDGGQRNTVTGERKGGPTPMSAADRAKQQEADEKRQRGQAVQAQRAVSMVSSLRDLRERTNGATSGLVGGQLRKIDGSPAFDLKADIETIKANLGFDRLDEMRQNSPTGGALGQVAVQELIALQSSVANLDASQSPAQLRKNLDRVITHYERYAKSLGYDITTPKADFHPAQRATAQRLAKNPQFKSLPVGSRGRPYAPRTEAEFKAIKPGAFYIDDDGEIYPKGR